MDMSAEHSPPQGQGPCWKRGQEDFESQRTREFALRFCLLLAPRDPASSRPKRQATATKPQDEYFFILLFNFAQEFALGAG